MDENTLTVIRAFGMEKEAKGNCHVGDRPLSNYMRSKAKKQDGEEKRAVDEVTSELLAQVNTTSFDSAKVAELSNALEKLAAMPLATVASKSVPKMLDILKGVMRKMSPRTAAYGAGIGGGVGGLSGLVAPSEDEGRLPSALRRGLMGAAMGGAGGAALPLGGAATLAGPMIGGAKPEQLSGLRNLLALLASVGTGTAGALGAGAAVSPLLGKQSSSSEQDTKKKDEGDETKPGVVKLESASDEKPKKAPEKKSEKESENVTEYEKTSATLDALKAWVKQGADLPCPGSKIRSGGMGRGLGIGGGAGPIGVPIGEKGMPGAAAPNVAELIEKLMELLKGGKLGAAPQKAASFGEFLKKAFDPIGSGVAPLGEGRFGAPLREGFKTTGRQERFDALSKWSLGRE